MNQPDRRDRVTKMTCPCGSGLPRRKFGCLHCNTHWKQISEPAAPPVGRELREQAEKPEELHGWEVENGVMCVVCPECAFTMDAGHVDSVGGGYTCPSCAPQALEHGQETRVETGPIQFGDDWPGVFIRGDTAIWWSIVLDQLAAQAEDVWEGITLRVVADALGSCDNARGPFRRIPAILPEVGDG